MRRAFRIATVCVIVLGAWRPVLASLRTPGVDPSVPAGVSLHLTDARLGFVLQSLAVNGKLNVVLPANLTQRVSMRLVNADPELALERLARAAGLDVLRVTHSSGKRSMIIVPKERRVQQPRRSVLPGGSEVTLQAKDASVRHIAPLLARGIVLQVDRNVPVRVTAHLQSIPAGEALQLIADAYDLQLVRHGSRDGKPRWRLER